MPGLRKAGCRCNVEVGAECDHEDVALERALHGTTKETFATMFGISHETLIEGGRALARGEGEIGQL